MASDKELEVKLAEIHENGRNERQKNVINLVLGLSSTLIGVYNAVQIKDTAAQVRRVYDDTPSAAAVRDVADKVDTNLLQWKAYGSKSPEDEAKAAAALGRAVADMP